MQHNIGLELYTNVWKQAMVDSEKEKFALKIESLKIKNFRGYASETTIRFNDFTALVGRNDIGKSTILEAMDLFFNDGKGVVRYDQNDLNVASKSKDFTIAVTFCELPDYVVVDSSYHTTFADEFLLNSDGKFEVLKVFNGKKCINTSIRALHPTNPQCAELHRKKNKELKQIIQQNEVECESLSVNSMMRKAIWQHFRNELQLEEINLDVTSGEDAKKIWESVSRLLPLYTLFQSDRQNGDGDKEVQDPLKAAVAQFLQDEEMQRTLSEIAAKVVVRLQEVSDRTLEKLREMDPDVADSLNPVIPPATSLKWADVFKNVSITSDDDIPINKRGGGVKRLILLNFFRAEAERRQEENSAGMIYAIEEPETSQHFSNQKILADALKKLSQTPNTQIVLTTHSGVFVKRLACNDLRLVSENENRKKTVTTAIRGGLLSYPSLNEVNFTAFGEATEEYHDELYGYILEHDWLKEFESGKPQRPYVRVMQSGTLKQEERTLTHYIRDVQHHPENAQNTKYTDTELEQSIHEMREFIRQKMERSEC